MDVRGYIDQNAVGFPGALRPWLAILHPAAAGDTAAAAGETTAES